MESFTQKCDELYINFTYELQRTEKDGHLPLKQAEVSIAICHRFLQQLRVYTNLHLFPDKESEIQFFKHLKPRFASCFIYYIEVYWLYAHWPAGSEQTQKDYLVAALEKIKHFFHKHKFFYTYFRCKHTYLDEQYFMRGKCNWQLCTDNFCYDADPSFTTMYDYTLSQVMAYDRLQAYLQKLLTDFSALQKEAPLTAVNGQELKWTGSIADATECIYAWYEAGVINNGQATLSDIAAGFQRAFNVDLGDFYRTWQHIGARKDEKCKFLVLLLQLLKKRLDDESE